MRYCTNRTVLLEDYPSCVLITPEDLQEGSLIPSTAGATETVTLQLPDDYTEDTTIYVGLKASDGSGETSALSNIVSTGVTSRNEYKYDDDDDDGDDGFSTWAIVLISAFGGIFLFVAGALLWRHKPGTGGTYPAKNAIYPGQPGPQPRAGRYQVQGQQKYPGRAPGRPIDRYRKSRHPQLNRGAVYPYGDLP